MEEAKNVRMPSLPGIIETMNVNNGSIYLSAYHQERLAAALAFSGSKLDFATIWNGIEELVKSQGTIGDFRMRLQINFQGKFEEIFMNLSPFDVRGLKPLRIGCSESFTSAAFPAHNFKTTDRVGYDAVLQEAQCKGFDDLIILNQHGEVVETAIFNILWKDGLTGQWYTPPSFSGGVAGVMRSYLIHKGVVKEKVTFINDLQQAASIKLCNALRGVQKVYSLMI